MPKKIIIWVCALVLSFLVGLYYIKPQVDAPTKMNWSIKVSPDTITLTNKMDLPNNYSKLLLEKINSKRQEKNLSALVVDETLNKAALARIAVISALGDYTGTISSVTREKSLEIVGYDHAIIGDLFFVVTDVNDDVVERAAKNSIESETILEPLFSDIGFADIQHQNGHYYYFILASKKKKTPITVTPTKKPIVKISWGGPDLWLAVNKERVSNGVGELTRKDELCTIASIRLNQLLDLGKLDGHSGFQPVLDRPDLKWIGEKYNVSEYLAQGFSTPNETVLGWKNTLGHKSLLVGGEYVWGCIYSQNTFAVAITAY